MKNTAYQGNCYVHRLITKSLQLIKSIKINFPSFLLSFPFLLTSFIDLQF